MGKLVKGFRSGVSRAKSVAKGVAKSENMGSLGRELLVLGGHAGLALASKNVSSLGPIPVKPDVAAIVAGGGMMMLGKGKTRKLGNAILKAGAHACITRWIADDSFTLVEGPDGNVRRSDQPKEEAPASV